MCHNVLFCWRALTNFILHRSSIRTISYTLDGSTICRTSDVSANVSFIVPTLTDVMLLDKFRIAGACRVLCRSEFCIHVTNCTCISRGIQLQYKLQHTRTWMEEAWMRRCVCYGPAVFFHHFCVITLSYREETFGVLLQNLIILLQNVIILLQNVIILLQNVIISTVLIFLKNCVGLKLRNLKLLQSKFAMILFCAC
jgi:hypothetical protein